MRSIDVETNVFALIWSLREDGEETENQILSRVLSDFVSIRDSEVKGLAAELKETASSFDSFQQQPSCSAAVEGKTSKRTTSHPFQKDTHMGKIRWVDDVFEAIRVLGGSATLHSIYKEVEMIRQTGGRSVPKSLDATIRRTLEDHSSDSANYRGTDLFANVGRGEWAIRRDHRA